ncbi:hypothetical protein MASR1M45_28020 [Candidatus Kapaibacterium sp.]
MFDSAYYYYNKSISYLDSTGIVSEIAENYTSLAELKMLQKNYDDAISYIEKSIKILESNEAQLRVEQCLSESYFNIQESWFKRFSHCLSRKAQ